MTASTVNGIISRCVLDCSFLEAVAADPEKTLGEYQIDPGEFASFREFDYHRLTTFAALVVKVQNNHVWELIPSTLSLINRLNLEVRVFSDFAPIHQQNRHGKISREEKTVSLLQFLKDLLPNCGPDELMAVFMHEYLQWATTRQFLSQQPARGGNEIRPASLSSESFRTVIPCVQGVLHLCRYAQDPVAAIAQVERGEDVLPVEDCTLLAYWGDPASRSVRAIRLDAHSFAVLAETNGTRTSRTVFERYRSKVSVPPLASREFRDVVEQLVEAGLLKLVSRNDLLKMTGNGIHEITVWSGERIK